MTYLIARCALLGLLLVGVLLLMGRNVLAEQVDVWIGTATPQGGLSRGIYYAQLNTDDGTLTSPALAAELSEPGFATLDPAGQVLYSVGAIDETPSVVAYRITRKNNQAALEEINSQPIGDGGAAHLATDREGKVLLTAQYGGSSVALFPLEPSGAIGARAQLVEHEGGSGIDANRQSEPHPHWVGTSPDNRFVFVPDLGMDQIVVYRLDNHRSALEPHGAGQLPPGAGPRHMTFHPSGDHAYVLNELALSVTRFAYDKQQGTLIPHETVPTLSEQVKARERANSASEIRVHPSGKFLYTANRGHDSITAFAIDASTGKLSLIEVEPIRGSMPRNFNLSPDGRWLLAAGRDSNTIAVFQIDVDSGELTYTGQTVFVPMPICVTFGTPR